MKLRFESDPRKAATNLAQPGVSFEEAASVFADPLAYTFADPDRSADEERMPTFGLSVAGRVLVVVTTERGAALRIISARKTTRHERGIYEQG